MDIRPELQLQAAIKAITDIVLPAVDPANKLAIEQAKLVIGTLNIVSQRMKLQFRYDRDELARSLALAETLQAQAADVPAARDALHHLAATVERGADVLDRAQADPAELEAVNIALRESIGALITMAHGNQDAADARHFAGIVLAHAKEQVLRERVWLLSQGWESDPKALPAIETLI